MTSKLRFVDASDPGADRESQMFILRALERKVLWLSSWMIHNANHIREPRDGLKVGGHQASSASVATMMTALYFDVLGPQDRVAVKPHASPVFHAIQYLLGNQTREKIERLRALGGAQSYPSRTKDTDDVDISTGSVGLGAAHTVFSSLVQDYVRLKNLSPEGLKEGRMIALVGDAELDEGNMYEALLEGWKKDIHNVWWVIDYNRQSLDSVISDRLFGRIDQLFENMGWRVVTMKYGKLQEQAFEEPGGDALRNWIDTCPNSLYSALTFKGGGSWREYLKRDLAGVDGIKALLDAHDDDTLHRLMTNLAGNDLDSGNGVEVSLEALAVLSSELTAHSTGTTHHSGNREIAAACVTQHPHVVGDLIEGEQQEAHVHALDDRPETGHRRTDRHTGEAVFGNRGIQDPQIAILFGKVFRHLVAAAVVTDVLTHHTDMRVAGHLLVDGFPQGVEEKSSCHGVAAIPASPG